MPIPDAVIPVFGFDVAIVKALNSYIGAWPVFDKIIWVVSSNPIFKGFLFVSILWWLGMRERATSDNGFAFALRWIVGLFVGIVIARYVQNFVPSHLRPISEPALGLQAFKSTDMAYFARLYSFPSDHAVMFFALSTAIFARHSALGMVAFVWSMLLICLPRIYFGYHYPSDILAGAALGVAIMAAALAMPVPAFAIRWADLIERKAPGLGYGFAFFISAEIAVNFDHLRDIVIGLGKIAGS